MQVLHGRAPLAVSRRPAIRKEPSPVTTINRGYDTDGGPMSAGSAPRPLADHRSYPASNDPRWEQWADLHDALHAEWTKMRTTPTVGCLAFTAVVLTAGLSAAAVAATTYTPGVGQDLAKISLTGIDLGQAVIAILAVLTIGNEYGTGMIATTLTAIPRRSTVLAAKAAMLTAVGLVTGTAAVLTSILAGRLLLHGNGFTTAHGYPLLSLGDGPTLRAAIGSVLYLLLIGLLSLGIATTVRDSATAIGVVLALLYLFPIITSAVTNPHWQRHLQQIGPMDAGLAIQNTTNLNDLPIGPWAGLGVLAAWAATAVIAGTLTLRLRDA
jgi:ABC-2 type transport system permease protein